MLKPLLVRLIGLTMLAVPAAAQIAPSPFAEGKVDSTRVAAMFANSQRTLKPASFVLDHRAELSLTQEQVKRLEVLVRSEEDSGVVRQIRITATMTRLMKKQDESNLTSQAGWAGNFSEKQLRDEACERAAVQADVIVNLMRDRQMVGNVLTMTQIQQVLEIETNDLLRALHPKQP